MERINAFVEGKIMEVKIKIYKNKKTGVEVESKIVYVYQSGNAFIVPIEISKEKMPIEGDNYKGNVSIKRFDWGLVIQEIEE